MTRSRRLYVLVFSCLLVVAAVLAVGARAWATATVHRTAAQCGRLVGTAGTFHRGRVPGRTGPGAGPRSNAGSWRVHALRVAGCSAWREVHGRMRHRHHVAPANLRPSTPARFTRGVAAPQLPPPGGTGGRSGAFHRLS